MAKRRKGFSITLIDMEQAERIANILGPTSAHAKAIDDHKRRSALGEDPVMGMTDDGTIIVVPRAETTSI